MSDTKAEEIDERTIIHLPGGARVTIHPDGKVDVYGTLDDDALAIIQALDPDAAVACQVPGATPAVSAESAARTET